MSKKTFYTHIIPTDTIIIKMERLTLSSDEKSHLMSILHSSIHTVVMDVILGELSEDDKKTFLSHVYDDNHETIWNFLHEKINEVEKKITLGATIIISQFEKDIDELIKQ